MKLDKLICAILIIFLCGVSQAQGINVYPDSINKRRLHKTIAVEAGSYLAGLAFLNNVWYKDVNRVPFNFYNDSKGYLQMDKFGHAYTAYRQSYSAYYALRKAGVDKKESLIYGGPIGFIFQAPIEVFDGLHEGWGFSWYDIAANTFGSALFIVQEAAFDEQIFLMKFSYSPSGYPKYHSALGENQLESFFLDYNAHTYWFSGNLQKLTGLTSIPPWLSVSFGYSANGMINEFDNPEFYRGEPFPELERHRQFLFSLDIDFSKVRTNKKWLRSIFNALNLIKIPFPAIEFNRVDGVRFRPLYF